MDFKVKSLDKGRSALGAKVILAQFKTNVLVHGVRLELSFGRELFSALLTAKRFLAIMNSLERK